MKRADCVTMTDSIILEDKRDCSAMKVKRNCKCQYSLPRGRDVETYTFCLFDLIENLEIDLKKNLPDQ